MKRASVHPVLKRLSPSPMHGAAETRFRCRRFAQIYLANNSTSRLLKALPIDDVGHEACAVFTPDKK